MDPGASTITWCRSHQDPITPLRPPAVPAALSSKASTMPMSPSACSSPCCSIKLIPSSMEIDGQKNLQKLSPWNLCRIRTWHSWVMFHMVQPAANSTSRNSLASFSVFGPSGKSLPLISPDSVLLFDWNFGKLLHLELKVGFQNFNLKLKPNLF